MEEEEMENKPTADELLFAGILLNRFEPLAPHHCGAVRDRVRWLSDEELRVMLQTGRWPTDKSLVRCAGCNRVVTRLDAADVTTYEGTRALCMACADKANERALIHHGIISPERQSSPSGKGQRKGLISGMRRRSDRRHCSTWTAIHVGETWRGSEAQCKQWAREREGAQVCDTFGFVRWATRNGRLQRV